jgi:uncharacterized protein YhjY with autotransporter beta-barrel domain
MKTPSCLINLSAGVILAGLITMSAAAQITPVATATTSLLLLASQGAAANETIDNTTTVHFIPASGSEAATGVALATGITSAGTNPVINGGTVKANATALVTRTNPLVVTLIALEKGTNTTTATANATGIASSSEINRVTSSGAVAATATAKIDPFRINLSLADATSADATLTANTLATGISGGLGQNYLTNHGSIAANASATVESTDITVTLLNAVTADTSLNANANAIGIAGGTGENFIHNFGDISASGTATAQAVGVTVSLATVAKGTVNLAANADATGIAGGAARDEVSNAGKVTAIANSAANRIGVSATLYDLSAVQEFFDDTTENETFARASAIGIDGAAGNDWLANLNQLSASATSKVFAVSVSLGSVGVPELSDIGNLIFGDPLVSLDRVALADATAMLGGAGDDELHNAGALAANAHAETDVYSVDVGLALPIPLSPPIGLSFASAGSSNSASATGIAGGTGNDNIRNTSPGVLRTSATSDATSLAVAASLDLGLDSSTNSAVSISAALLDAKTVSEAQATGIAGGSGNNTIRNEGSMNTTAAADALSVVANLNFVAQTKGLNIAAAIADAETIGAANATGILGGTGDDTIVNATNAHNTVSASATVSSWLVSADIKGTVQGVDVGVPVATAAVIATANAIGMEGGTGQNSIRNESSLSTTALADADNKVASLKVTGTAQGVAAGVSIAEASTTATAAATGMRGGAGNDEIHNVAGATNQVAATADVNSLGVSVSIVGPTTGLAVALGRVKAETLAEATAIGIASGDGTNVVHNAGVTEVNANGKALNIAIAGGVTVTLDTGVGIAGAQVDAGSTARAESIGIIAGDEGNLIFNTGTIRANATNTAQTVAVTVNANIGLAGLAVLDANASTVANSIATGIQGGAGNDAITNAASGEIAANASAAVKSGAVGVNVSILGGGVTDASASASNSATGITGGAGRDTVSNEGHVAVTADAHGSATSFNFGGLVGVAVAKAGTTADTLALGIDGGSDADWLDNSGTLAVRALSDLKAGAISITGVGVSTADAKATARATGIGMSGADGSDVVFNSGVVDVQTTSKLDVSSKSFQLIGYASAEIAETTAAAELTGLSGGAGNDVLLNTGRISLALAENQPMAEALGQSAAWNLIGVTHSEVVLAAQVAATGMAGGVGDDMILNLGTNIVGGPLSGVAMAKVDASGSSWTFGGAAGASTVAAAQTDSIGISGGDGNDWLANRGRLETTATATLDSQSDAYATFGGSSASAKLTAGSSATGIEGGAGNDQIANAGFISAGSSARSVTHSAADTGILYGEGCTASDAQSAATAYGATLGEGQNRCDNSSRIEVLATGLASASAYSDGADIWNGNAQSRAGAAMTNAAIGILAGQGNNSILNTGDLTVLLQKTEPDVAMAVASATADGDGADGDGWGLAAAVADGKAAGIVAGDGANHIANTGVITVKSEPTAGAWVNVDGDNTGNATGTTDTKVFSEAVGIKIGSGTGQIRNSGTLSVTANAKGTVSSYVDEGWLGSRYVYQTVQVEARAAGISTGDGNQQIENTGTINVVAHTESNLGSAAHAESAIGIATGNGADIINNYGSISATTSSGTVAGIGVAINSGGGNDQVRLANGSSVVGSIELGAGDDQLIICGTPPAKSAWHGGAGRDSLVLEGSGSCTLDQTGLLFTSFENMVKCGAGTFSLGSGLTDLGSCEVTCGVLEIHGDFNLGGGKIKPTIAAAAEAYHFGAQINGDGSHGQMLVLGQAYLDGEITIAQGPGVYANGRTYDVLIATNGLISTFSQTNLPTPKPLLSFEWKQLADRVQIQAQASFAAFGRNRVEKTVGEYLDRIAPTVTGDLNDVLVEFQNLTTDPQITLAYASLSPDSYDNYSRATYRLGQQYSQRIQQRLDEVRLNVAGNRAVGSMAQTDFPVLLAATGSGIEMSERLAAQQSREAELANSLWAGGFGQWSKQEAEAGYTGYDANPWGIAIGYDRRVGQEFTLGVSAAYASTHLDLNQNLGNGEIQTYSGSAYGGYVGENFHFEGVFSYGYNDYDNRRNVIVGAITQTAESSHAGHALGSFISGGYVWRHQAWRLEPFASLQYTYLDEEAFQESGAGGASLAVQDRQTDSLASELGCRLGYVWQKQHFTVIPELSLAWNYDFNIDDRVLTASYVGSPTAILALPGQDAEQHGLTTGAAVTFLLRNGVSTSVRYNGEFRNRYSAHAIAGELRFTF